MAFAMKLGVLVLILSYVYISIIYKGPRLSYKCSLLGLDCPKYEDFPLTTDSTFDPKFEKVVKEFQQNFVNGEEIGAQLSFWYKGKNVINVTSGKKNLEMNLPMSSNTLQVVYSVSKAVCSFAVAMLVDRGLVKYEDKIASIWPEFGVNNKQDVTVADLLQHKAGLLVTDSKITFEELKDYDLLAKKLAAQPHFYGGEKKSSYSPVIIGHYVNEIVRRVDPQKRSIDRFVDEEINKVLGTEFYYLVTQDQIENQMGIIHHYPLVKIYDLIFKTLVVEPIRQKLGFEPDLGIKFFSGLIDDTVLFARGVKLYPQEILLRFVNQPESHAYLIPGASMKANAQSLGKLGALIANGGELNGIRLISKEGLAKALEVQQEELDLTIGKKFKRTTAGWAFFDKNYNPEFIRGNTNYIGWQGYGGSTFYWNQEKNFGVGYVMNSMGPPTYDIDPRSQKLISTFYELIEKYENENENGK